VSTDGVVVYRTTEDEISQLVLYAREGKKIRTVGPPGRYTQVTLSPDEKQLALNVIVPSDQMNAERIWLLRLNAGAISRLEFGGGTNTDPVWSPDSQQIAFASFQAEGQKTQIYRWSTGDASPTLLWSDGNANKPDDWSPQGFLLCRRDNSVVFSLPVQSRGAPLTFGSNSSPKDQLHLTPDGTRVAYNTLAANFYSDPADHPNVFVARFPGFSETVQLSVDGGVQPLWARGGRELYYLAPDGSVMWVDMGDKASSEPKTPQALFRSALQPSQWRSQYCVSADGQRIYILEPVTRRRDVLHVITR
jgi:Tol biopolymer transport system component